MPKRNAKTERLTSKRKENKNIDNSLRHSSDEEQPSNDEMIHRLAHCLFESSLCFSQDEAMVVADDIILSVFLPRKTNQSFMDETKQKVISSLQEHFECSIDEAIDIVHQVINDDGSNDDDDDDSSSVQEQEKDDIVFDDIGNSSSDDDAANYLKDGECELCERYMKLTKHHLIPKATWSKMKKRIELSVKDDGGGRLTADDFDNLPSVINNTTLRIYLAQTCDICRPCHSKLHQVHDLITLATKYNTVEKLINDEDIRKFCKWASQQRTGKYTRFK